MIFPEWTIGNIILYGYLSFLVLVIAPMELKGAAMMEYSKFHAAKGLPSRQGMTIIYGLPIVALVFAGLPYIGTFTLVQWLVFGTVGFSFTKRLLEVYFVHKYSGTVSIPAMSIIAVAYSVFSFLIGRSAAQSHAHAVDVITYIGLGVYVVGIVFNFSHHRILALLRTDSQTYTIPQGGLFNLVVCPHFLFEMTIWLGIFLVSRHYAAFLFFGFAVAYLSARALRTLRWYHERFPDFPKERKAVFPFIL